MNRTILVAAVTTFMTIGPADALGQTPIQVGQTDVYTLRWAIPADPGPSELSKDQLSQPVMSPDAQSIFRSYSNGRVEKRATSTGEIHWVRELGVEVQSALGYMSSLDGQDWIAVVDALGTLHALSTSEGSTLKTLSIGGGSSCSPIETKAGILFSAGDDRLVMIARNLEEAKTIWSTERATTRGMTMLGAGCPTLTTNLVCHGRSDGTLACYDLESGALSWKRRLASQGTRLAIHDVDAGPIFHKGSIYAASVSGGLYRLNAATGEIEWQIDIPNLHRLGGNQFGLVALTLDGLAIGLAETGEKRFVTKLPTARLENLLVGKSLALITAGETGLVLLETERGKPIQARALGAEALALPATSGRHLVIQDASAFLYHFELNEPGS